MPRMPWFLSLVAIALTAGHAQAETLRVGPQQQFTQPSEAIAAARDGDTIEIAAGVYRNDWAKINASDLTLRGVGGRVVMSSEGLIPNGKAIWIVNGRRTRIENIEFRGARVRDKNGAGLRLGEGDITLRGCRFFDNENGILGGHGDGTVDIRHCEFAHNSLVARPATHNLYINRCKRLIFKYNYSHHAEVAHLLKSRARENHIMYNRFSDEADGSSSFLINLPNAGRAYIIGNILHQGPQAQNSTLVAYGDEGPQGGEHELCLVNNTLINERERGTATFVHVRQMPDAFQPILRNNIFAGEGRVTNWPHAVREANFTGSVSEARFVDREDWDLRLQAGSPAVDAGTAPGQAAGGVDLRPTEHYVHPLRRSLRPRDEKIDQGAYEHASG